MRGLIGKKDVLCHPFLVIQGFGWKVFLRTLRAPAGLTFLEIISEGIPNPSKPHELELSQQLDKLISFEIRCSQFYSKMSEIFRNHWGLAPDFFRNLSEQEEGHAEILRIAKVEISRHYLWNTVLPIKPGLMEKTDRMLSEVEGLLRLPEKLDIKKGLEAVERLESSEINTVFDDLLHSIHTPFLKKIYRIVPALSDHQTYLDSLLPLLKEEAAYEKNLRRPLNDA